MRRAMTSGGCGMDATARICHSIMQPTPLRLSLGVRESCLLCRLSRQPSRGHLCFVSVALHALWPRRF